MIPKILQAGPGGCLAESALEKLAGGEIPEPGLSLCLGHVCDCPGCSDRLDTWVRRVEMARCRAVPTPGADEPVPVVFLERGTPDAPLPALDPPSGEGDIGAIGRYRVKKVLGRGPMAVTWGAFEPELNRRVAIKMLEPGLAADPEVRSAFLHEARAMAAIHHDGIVPVHTVDKFRETPYFVMPLLEGESLQARLGRGRLPEALVERFTRQLAGALAAAHASGVVHRDVKPSNIWLRRRTGGGDDAVLLDFGIALPADAAGSGSGTRGYRSPEQALGAPCDPRSDHFALGCVVFEMLTGRAAWPAGGGGAELPRPLADPAVPSRWKPLLGALFSLDPSGRPSRLEEIERLIPVNAPPSNKGLALASFVLVLLMLGFGGLWMSTWKPGPRPGEPRVTAPSVPPQPSVTAPAQTAGPRAAQADMLAPRRVFPGLPSVLGGTLGSASPGGEAVALYDETGRVALFSAFDGSVKSGFECKPAPRAMAFSGAMLALAIPSGKILLHDASNGLQAASFEADPAGPMAWAGGDRLLFRAKGGIAVAARAVPGGPWEVSEMAAAASRDGGPQSVVALAPRHGTDLVAALYSGPMLAIYDLKAQRLLQARINPVLFSGSAPQAIAWRDDRTLTVIADRKVTEHEIGRGANDVAVWELPSSALALAWLGPDEYAMVHDAGAMVPQVVLGRRGKRVFHARLDTGGAWIDRLEWLGSAGTLAAYGRDGSVRLYSIPGRDRN